ncbi:MAG: hypothetical protein KDD10_29140, partial [Phaeodactylibacter sp.]|nr:hypothetical protein [Phaeodactylibacter sp.]
GLSYVSEGLVTTSWNAAKAEPRNADAVMFSLVFRAKADAQLSDLLSVNSRITKAEAYSAGGSYMGVEVAFSGRANVGGTFELYQNTP